ncbi:diaminopimelate epimerase [Pyrinomonas sp.]|uniref:diaminopimelate epimerase n=1 Tax=Pyrinomonas sp. TaxID=2080306 RepID=UPI00331D5E36
MRFFKFHGYGNDYLIIEEASLQRNVRMGEFVRRLCDRHRGAGADGVAIIGPSSEADFHVRIFNADGSEAAMSGNGTRCAAAYLYYNGLWSADELQLSTRAGIKLYRLCGRYGTRRFRFEAEIGRPVFESAAIPMRTDEPREIVLDYPLEVGEQRVAVTALQMCNPNCCVFVEDFARVDWRALGSLIERHPRFPERTNVEFIRVESRDRISVRVWERGVGETASSGTGACAAAVAACLKGATDRRVMVEMPGGTLEVEWREDGEVVLSGTAEAVYRAEWLDLEEGNGEA